MSTHFTFSSQDQIPKCERGNIHKTIHAKIPQNIFSVQIVTYRIVIGFVLFVCCLISNEYCYPTHYGNHYGKNGNHRGNHGNHGNHHGSHGNHHYQHGSHGNHHYNGNHHDNHGNHHSNLGKEGKMWRGE